MRLRLAQVVLALLQRRLVELVVRLALLLGRVRLAAAAVVEVVLVLVVVSFRPEASASAEAAAAANAVAGYESWSCTCVVKRFLPSAEH